MRKILFRGKRIDNGEWVEGHYGEYMLMSGESISVISIPKKEAICGSICYDVEASTVGQYTGLTDKNGNKIFEGDIIRQKGFVNNYYTSVWYASGRFLVNDYETLLPADLGGISRYKIEVIGNLHDNPELLEANE